MRGEAALPASSELALVQWNRHRPAPPPHHALPSRLPPLRFTSLRSSLAWFRRAVSLAHGSFLPVRCRGDCVASLATLASTRQTVNPVLEDQSLRLTPRA
ncbi:hypothetical protein [Haloarchaeobius sp. TZWSO28]|uniref:hypothetical protein n=1 Tax=Haloarchaeobius sp. TZWSO28 TaxID=3446119 RepID=UPI003EB6B106